MMKRGFLALFLFAVPSTAFATKSIVTVDPSG
jgi:hypothetical protein